MASEVGICNEALALLGAASITDLNEAKVEAVLCNRFYGPNRDYVLRDAYWNSARAEAALAPLAAAPLIGWGYKFTLPADPYCLRVIRVENAGYPVAHEVRGRELFADFAAVNVLFNKRVSDPNEFDAMLCQAVVFRLAYMLAFPIRRDKPHQEALLQQYQIAKAQAEATDAQESDDKPLPRSSGSFTNRDLIDIRYGS